MRPVICGLTMMWLVVTTPVSVSEVGGRLAVVERDGPVGRARLYVRTAAAVAVRDVFDAAPPVLAGFEPQAGFAF